MQDKDIVNLYWQRDQRAIEETAQKYGEYCKAISKNILGNNEDAEECVNDTYLRAWNSMPENRPEILSAYLGKIIRHLSFDKFRQKKADKRGKGEAEAVLEELAECVSGTETTEDEFSKRLLILEIDRFLDSLSKRNQGIFVCRYWYAMPVAQIAVRFSVSESNASVILSRLREKLKAHLTERGFDL